MEPFAAAPHQDVLALLVQLAALLGAARLLGTVSQRLGQPAVLGEILAGVVLGPTLLAGAIPALHEWLVPQTATQGHLLELVGLLGALFLLLMTGLETDLALIRHHARTAIGVAAGGLLLPFATGFALGLALPETLMGAGAERVVFALFLATALSISSIAVIGKVLIDMHLMRRDIGQTIIAAAVIDDTIGWMALAIVAGLSAGAALTVGSVAAVFLTTIAFVVLSFTLGRMLVRRLLSAVQARARRTDLLLTTVVVLMFAWAAISSALNLEAVLGAFIMGMLVGQVPSLPAEMRETLERLTFGIFAPIFFATAGLKMDLLAIVARVDLLALTGIVILVGAVGKIGGAYLGSQLSGTRDHWRGLAFGAALNARAAMGIIIATIGLSLNIITQDLFSILVIMAMATAIAAPPSLRWIVPHIRPDASEIDRLQREALAGESWLLGLRRILLPVRYGDGAIVRPDHAVEAQLLERLAHGRSLAITLLTVAPAAERDQARRSLDDVAQLFGGHQVNLRVVDHPNVAEAILNEAERGYQLLVMGAPSEARSPDVLFTNLVDYVARLSPCPTIVARGWQGEIVPGWRPERVLVPTNGQREAAWAAETAFALNGSSDLRVFAVHVVEDDRSLYTETRGRVIEARRDEAALEIVEEITALGERWGVETSGHVLHDDELTGAILRFQASHAVDLIVLGTEVRPGSHRLSLGPRVERIIEEATCPVVVVNAP